MSETKLKKSPTNESKPHRSSHHHSEHARKRDVSRSKEKAASHRSRTQSKSRSPDWERKHRHDNARSRVRVSPERKWPSYSRQESGTRLARRCSRSRSPLDSSRRCGLINEKPTRVLGVFGLSLYTDERVLKDVFAQYGPVEDIQVILDHHTGVSRGFAFIYMKHLNDAIQAREYAPGTEIDGRKIRVDFSVTDFSGTSDGAGYMGRTLTNNRVYQNRSECHSTRHLPLPLSRDHFYTKSSRSYRGRSHSYSLRHYER